MCLVDEERYQHADRDAHPTNRSIVRWKIHTVHRPHPVSGMYFPPLIHCYYLRTLPGSIPLHKKTRSLLFCVLITIHIMDGGRGSSQECCQIVVRTRSSQCACSCRQGGPVDAGQTGWIQRYYQKKVIDEMGVHSPQAGVRL